MTLVRSSKILGRKPLPTGFFPMILVLVVIMLMTYSVYEVHLKDREDLHILHGLEVEMNLDYWQLGAPGLRPAHVMVSAENKQKFSNLLDVNGIKHDLYMDNVADVLNNHDEEMFHWRKTRDGRIFPFQDYPTYTEINAYLERIAAQYPQTVTLVNAGKSFEGRDIKYLKISTTNFTDTTKPIYFMNAMIHAREWVTTPVALYAIHRLVEDVRAQERDVLESTDWIIMPLANPDGYEYTHTDDRLWRRTRSYNPSVNETCYGVDGNRNFNVSFNTIGVSSDPCSNIYPGTRPFSEVEMSYIRDVLHEYVDRIQLYLDIHSQGNMVLFAYGDHSLPPDAVNLHMVGASMGAAIDVHKLPQAPFYLVGNSALVLYGTSGSAQDYGQLVGVPFSFTLELPGYGYGFVVPPQYIEQIVEETWQGIVASARVSAAFYKARINI
ncbi:carboxypeptidase B-like [Battus philenor]|uniref:carboxypeptidase B-like n=1 Tax=Battus philenor TaxID=42288 RepID=UPI0035CF891C